MSRIAIIDGDTPLWTACYFGKDVGEQKMLDDLDKFLTEVIIDTKADYFVGFLKGKDKLFRKEMFPDYKGNRPEVPDWLVRLKPIVENHLTKEDGKWKFELAKDGYEADDAVASIAYQQEVAGNTPIVCSSDKDLKQVAGWYYNLKRRQLDFVTEEQAGYNLALQILSGDVVDNIKPLRKGFGPVTAGKALAVMKEDQDIHLDMWATPLIFMHELGVIQGTLKFAENALKATLRRDLDYRAEIREVPDYIKQLYQVNI